MATFIRTGTSADLDDVVALWAANGGPSRLASGRAEAELLVRRDPDALIVAEDQGTIVGTLVVGWDGWRCHLYRMAVADSARRQGIAALLFSAARERAATLGARRIDAMVADENDGAIIFWQSLGFEMDTHDHRWSVIL